MELMDVFYENYSKVGMEYIVIQVIKGVWLFEVLWYIIKIGDFLLF